ncbi:hypothetical protein ACIQNI_22960 [Streptomyces sp. NPDC091266]|uniref:hypothetical protein n=1 Tax=Streptomyces sp. NPDC091266 TaxID=3365978 RepID=UPI0038079D31
MDEPVPGDVEPAQHAGGGRGDDTGGEVRPVVAAAAAGVHDGRHTLANAREIGREAEAGGAVVDMGVQVDQAGRDQQSARVVHLGARRIDRPGPADDGDPVARHGEISGRRRALLGVDQQPAADHKIESDVGGCLHNHGRRPFTEREMGRGGTAAGRRGVP